MNTAIDHNFKPRLRHCTLIDDPQSSVTKLVVGKSYFDLDRIEGDRNDLLALKSYFDGRYTVDDISRNTGLSSDDVVSVVREFEGAGLLQLRHADPTITVGDFTSRVEEASMMWRRQIGLHRLFSGLQSGHYRPEVFFGLLIETFHYVHLLPRTLKLLSVGMNVPQFREVVGHYADEEMDHYLEYERALAGVPRIGCKLGDAHPTVGTLSLVRNFESIGRRSELSLVCCLQLIEARVSEIQGAEDHLVGIARRYGMTDIVVPFIHHMKADIDLGRSNLLVEALDGVGDIDAADANTAVNDMHDVKHCFDVFHNSIIEYYNDISNYIPRPSVDYFAL